MNGEPTFAERMDELSTLVGHGMLEATVEVNQVYAHYQDSGHGPDGKPAAAFSHPRGGNAFYLTDGLTAHGPEYAQKLADAIGEEVPMADRMAQVTEDLAQVVFDDAPREFWLLRNSAHPRVVDDGHLSYDRPPLVPRLSQAELNAIRAAGAGDVTQNNGQNRRASGALGYSGKILARGGHGAGA